MLLKYNISNIKYDRHLIDVDFDSSEIITTDDYVFFKLKTYKPHRLNINDIVFLSKEITTSTTYNGALDYLKRNPSQYVHLLNDVSKNKYDNQDKLIEKDYAKGYYQLGRDINDEYEIIRVDDSNLGEIFNKYNSMKNFLRVSGKYFSDDTFSLSYERTKKLYVDEVIYGNEYNSAHVIGDFPVNLVENEEFTLMKKVYSYHLEKTATKEEENMFHNVTTNNFDVTENLGYGYVIFLGKLYKWTYRVTEISCIYRGNSCFRFEGYDVLNNDTLEIEDNRFTYGDSLNHGVSFYEYYGSINFNIPLIGNNVNELNDSDICKTYFNTRKNDLITGIDDYEKRCFTPYHYNVSSNEFTPVSGINFNLFFRDRGDSEEWSTNDSMGWNQYKIDDKGNFSSNPSEKSLTKGDLLGMLGFTDDDVYYRKKKISKSFLRLSFYTNNTPLNNMLLFYSTIFFDSGDLFGKYMKNVHLKSDGTTNSLVSYANGGENNLTASFKVNDRYNKEKSSEGFYLYLFPDNIEPISNDVNNGYTTRTIYMKAEFNHAGYGKTIPLMYPTQNNTILNFSNSNFPKSLINSNGDLTELYKHLYIPLKVTYNKDLGDYIYYFDLVNMNNNELTFNLFEPKVNSLT